MNKTRIEWVKNPDGSQGFTWNPVTGCLHPCKDTYCYARRIAKRFRPLRHIYTTENFIPQERPEVDVIAPGIYVAINHQPFIMDFAPTLYPGRLDDPRHRKKPSTIFVCSMADLFGRWVPGEWIEAVLETVRACPQHTFIFLTKNPERYHEFEFPGNCLLGATAIDQAAWLQAVIDLDYLGPRTFISAEPLLGPIEPRHVGELSWLIIGADSNRGAKKPKPEWGDELVLAARKARVPVFVKNDWPWPNHYFSYEYQEHLVCKWPQEFPEGWLTR